MYASAGALTHHLNRAKAKEEIPNEQNDSKHGGAAWQ
jgi:hypothetical protein